MKRIKCPLFIHGGAASYVRSGDWNLYPPTFQATWQDGLSPVAAACSPPQVYPHLHTAAHWNIWFLARCLVQAENKVQGPPWFSTLGGGAPLFMHHE